MKKLNNSFIFIFICVLAFSCLDPDEIDTSKNATEGGLVEATNPLVNYIVGSDTTYRLNLRVYQGDVISETVELLATFNTVERDVDGEIVYRDEYGEISDAETGSITSVSSNEVSLGTITPDAITGIYYYDFDFEAEVMDQFVINGTSFNEGAIPESDGDLLIGDNWTVNFYSTRSDGEIVTSSDQTTVSVATRYAGSYLHVDTQYWRVGALETFTWLDGIDIESIDATTYKMNGFALWDDQELYFQIDPATNAITFPDEWDGVAQTLNDQPITTCITAPADLSNIPCGEETNIVTPMEDGADVITMSVGYFTAGSGAREFYFVLVKNI